MNNNNTICKHYCSLSPNQCYYCHPQEISRSYHCCCTSYSIPMEEMGTWIIICSLIFLLYNTIRICIITFLILFLIYWIYKRNFIREFIEKNNNSDLSIIKLLQSIGRKWINLTSSTDDREEQKGEYTSLIDPDAEHKYSNNNIDHSDETLSISNSNITDQKDDNQHRLSTKSSLNSSPETDETSNSDFSKANTCNDPIIKVTGDRIIRSKQSTTKKLLIKNTQQPSDSNLSKSSNRTLLTSNSKLKSNNNIIRNIHYENSISQPGYHGPIHTVSTISFNNEDSRQNLSKSIESLSTATTTEQMVIQPEINKDNDTVRFLSQLDRSSADNSKTLAISDRQITNFIAIEKMKESDKENIDVEQMTFTRNESIADVIEQTKSIRQAIETLHDDILQLKTHSKISNLSIEEKTILKLATENLIQAIISTRIDKQSNIPNIKSIPSEDKTKSKSNISEVESIEIDNSLESHHQHPKCITVQTSLEINSSMPRVPTKATVIAINDDDDEEEEEKSYDDHTKIPQHIIVTAEQFENIPIRKERKSEDALFLQRDSIKYNNEESDWPHYLSKSDPFPNSIQMDLPIIQSDDQHSSFKQTFLSHFHHRRPKLGSTNIPATLHSSSLNARNNITTTNSSHFNSYLSSSINTDTFLRNQSNFNQYQSNSTTEQQEIVQKLLNDKASFNYIWNKTLNHLKQRIFRVRKSRIIVSFDDIHQEQKEAGDNDDKKNFDTLVNTVVHEMSTEIDHARSQLTINTTNQSFSCSLNNNEQQTNILNRSIVSLFQSFDRVIQEGELSINNDKQYTTFCQHDSDNEDSLSAISNSLYSVTSQLMLT